MLFVVCGLVHVVCCLLFVVVDCCLLFAVRSVLLAVYRVAFAVCCCLLMIVLMCCSLSCIVVGCVLCVVC